MWLNVSLIIFAIIEILVIGFAEPRMKEVAKVITKSEGEEIPKEFFPLMKRVQPFQTTVHILTIVVTALMIVKPF